MHALKKWADLSKFDAKTTPGKIVGYTERSNTYKIYVPELLKVITTCDLIVAPHRREPDRIQELNIERPENRQTIELDESTKPDDHPVGMNPFTTPGSERPHSNRSVTLEELNRRRNLLDEFFQQFREGETTEPIYENIPSRDGNPTATSTPSSGDQTPCSPPHLVPAIDSEEDIPQLSWAGLTTTPAANTRSKHYAMAANDEFDVPSTYEEAVNSPD